MTKHGTYSGQIKELQGKTALLRYEGKVILAQFDDLKGLPANLTHGWSVFDKTDFIEDTNENGHEVNCNCLVCLPEPHSRF